MTSLPAAQPGVRMTRRVALHGGWALPAMWMLSREAQGRRALSRPDDVESLLRRWTDETEELVAQSEPNEDEHLHRLCADLARFDPGAFPERKEIAFERDGLASGPVHSAMPFLVLQFDLEPGAVIQAHNHVGWSFLSLGVRGEATVRHFEPADEAPEPGELAVDFEVREVSSCLLYPGRTSTLTRARANIHWFRAGEQGARFLDFGVKLPDPGDGPRTFSAMELDPEPRDPVRRTYTARWLGNIYAK